MTRFLPALLLVAVVAHLEAAPPVLNYFYPAGGQRGQTVSVDAAGTYARWPVQAWCSDSDVSLQVLPERGKLKVTIGAKSKPGVCLIRLYDDEGPSLAKAFLVGALPEISEQEPNDDWKKPQTVAASGLVINGKLGQPGDVDCFAVSLKKGQTLVADIEANKTLGSPMDGVLQLLSPTGNVLIENNDENGLDPRVVYTATSDGVYVVRLFAFPAVPDSSIRFAGAANFAYRLTLTTGPYADHVFPLAASRQNPGTTAVQGWNLPDSARTLAVPPSEFDETALFHDSLMRPAAVRLESHACLVEREPNDAKRPQEVTLPVTISGRIDTASDVDTYRVAGKKGQTIQIQVESRALGFPLDPAVRVLDAAGKVLAEQDDAGSPDVLLSFAIPADGMYDVELRDLFGHGGQRYVYRLRLLIPEPDFAMTVNAERFTFVAGKTLEIPVTIERRQGFNEEITLTMDGLPAGVTAEAVRVSAGQTTAKMILTANQGPSAGFPRIVGHSQGRARFAVALAMRTPVNYLWLKVSKP